jgi:tight adherence protein B
MSFMVLLPFLLVSMVVFGVLAFIFRETAAARTTSRLDILVGKKQLEAAPDLLKKVDFDFDQQSLFAAVASRIPNLERYFIQADCNIKPGQLVLISVILAGLGMTGSWLAKVPIFFMPLAGGVMFLIPFAWLWNKRRVRLNTFAAQLPDAMELVARALRAGHALGAGMHLVADEMPSPIADEFGRVYEEQNLGIALEDAMRGMTERVPNLDLRFFVTSVAIQRQTGGDLAEILDKIGYVIRERYRILGQVKALTGEGRLSGVVLIALPFVLFLVMLHIQPGYVQTLWTEPEGIKMSIFALFMQILGAAVIKKIVDIKV